MNEMNISHEPVVYKNPALLVYPQKANAKELEKGLITAVIKLHICLAYGHGHAFFHSS